MAKTLIQQLQNTLNDHPVTYVPSLGELTLEIAPKDLRYVCQVLRDTPELDFSMLMDLCAVDYSTYGTSQWDTLSTTRTGFSRGVRVHPKQVLPPAEKPRFAVVYHLLSMTHNHRLRLKAYLDDNNLLIDSVMDIWNSANWFEREAFDLFGILFAGHNDLRRILTDYGFIGHPFRKDFPLIGNVELRYDAESERIVYEPVSIPQRVLVPKVIRLDQERLAPHAEQIETRENNA
jgi:NADH-quinone oxidoreductase subunit C